MDNLARNAMLAKQAGMSYGKWMAMQQPVPIKKKELEETKVCPHCGKQFNPRSKRQKYCDSTCSQRFYYENNKEELARRIRESRKRKEAVTNA